MEASPRRYWVSGRLVPAADPAFVRELLSRPGCYTTARVTSGRALWATRHCLRLRRDARALGIGVLRDEAILQAFEELGRAEFGTGTGVVRLQACRDDGGCTQLVAIPRPLGPETRTWRAIVAPFVHPGPGPHPGAKRTHQEIYERGRALARRARSDDALLVDAGGRLVEGTRTNLLVVTPDGVLATPDPALGAVAGLALEIVRERVPELTVAELDEAQVRGAAELIALNAVRGAQAIVRLNGREVSSGRPGPWAERLSELLRDDEP